MPKKPVISREEPEANLRPTIALTPNSITEDPVASLLFWLKQQGSKHPLAQLSLKEVRKLNPQDLAAALDALMPIDLLAELPATESKANLPSPLGPVIDNARLAKSKDQRVDVDKEETAVEAAIASEHKHEITRPAQKAGTRPAGYVPPKRQGKKSVTIFLDEELLVRFKALAMDISKQRIKIGQRKVCFQDLIVELMAVATRNDAPDGHARRVTREIERYVRRRASATASLGAALRAQIIPK